jgi:hypothetical protein
MASQVSRVGQVRCLEVWVGTDSMASAQRVDVQEGICLVALEELHGRDLACGKWSEGLSLHSINHIGGLCIPLMILQKMHAAAMLCAGWYERWVLLGVVVCD